MSRNRQFCVGKKAAPDKVVDDGLYINEHGRDFAAVASGELVGDLVNRAGTVGESPNIGRGMVQDDDLVNIWTVETGVVVQVLDFDRRRWRWSYGSGYHPESLSRRPDPNHQIDGRNAVIWRFLALSSPRYQRISAVT
jgi:hypothetical protein